jgi:hypothetical protein
MAAAGKELRLVMYDRTAAALAGAAAPLARRPGLP